MYRVSEGRNVSLELSEVLGDIGVNERMVQERRKTLLVCESLQNICSIFNYGDACSTTYNFGSQSEGSTTIGLRSDHDNVIIITNVCVIQELAEWKRGVKNMLIVQDEATSPGYCLLQALKSDAPLVETHVVSNGYLRDDKGRILMKNTYMNDVSAEFGTQQNGPASTTEHLPGLLDRDTVIALYCDSWPKEGRGWLERRCVGNWPSADIKRLAVSKGCFLVPVGSKCNNLCEVEWRISTSIAERLMMFDLNITQIRCYVMMKFISKTFLTINGQSTITSFMCKCIVFHCIENTHAYCWREDNLFPCVMKCLSTLYDQVQRLNCPHFIIPTNNLMAQRIDSDQQRYLMSVLNSLINSNADILYDIQIDNLGKRLRMKLTNVLPCLSNLPSQLDTEVRIVNSMLMSQGRMTFSSFYIILLEHTHLGLLETASLLFEGIQRLQSHYYSSSDTAVQACTYVVPLLCTFVGSVLASYSVYTNHTVSPEAIWWFSAGFDSDVSYSRLKLASAFYCAGDINNAEITLRELDSNCTDDVIAMCVCYACPRQYTLPEWTVHLYRNNELFNIPMAFCVKFVRCERSIIPQELRQELFRSTEIEIENRSHFDKKWMDFAVVDALPYLYFLQYKVYKHLGRHQQYRQALSKLLRNSLNEPNLGHRETAWNLLGQCMEQENMPADALRCYQKSLALRPHDNAANFHMARLQRL